MNGEAKRNILTKVPEITLYFWIIKILTTGMGESTSDFLVSRFNPLLAVAVTGIMILLALIIQLSRQKYIAWIYWLTVVMVAIFGTMAADILHVGLGIPYIASTLFFAIVLVAIFIAWHAKEKTLSIHSVYTLRREIFYWLTVLATFALGTAVGDLTASTLGLGYLSSGILFAILIAIVALGYYIRRRKSTNAVLAFWLAYILTRPLGASFADWMGKSHAIGGLGFGDGTVSLGLTILILCLVGYMAISKKDVQKS